MTDMKVSKYLQKQMKDMQQEIVDVWGLLKFAVAEVWLAAVVIAGCKYFGAGPEDFRTCADWLLRLMAVKISLKIARQVQWMADCLQYEIAVSTKGCHEKLRYMEVRQMQEQYTSGDIVRQVSADILEYNEAFGNRRQGLLEAF
jgi:hypothetical protein